MNKQDFIRLIKDPSQVSSKDSDNLEDLIANFPYCQAAHILLAKISHQNSSMLAKQKLSKAAAYVLERQRLKKIVLSVEDSGIRTSQEQVIYPSGTAFIKEMVVAQPEVDKPLPPIQLSPSKEVKVNPAFLADESRNKLPDAALISEEDELTDVSKSEKDPEVRSAFFKELEQNLEKLKKFKEKNELSKFVEDIQIPPLDSDAPPTPDQKSFPQEDSIQPQAFQEPIPVEVQKVEIEKIQEDRENKITPDGPELKTAREELFPEIKQSPQEPRSSYNLYSSRLEDVLIIEGDEKKEASLEYDLLTDYLQFLSARKKILFRSREKVNNIITKFINEEPTIPYLKNDELSDIVEDLSEESTKVSNHIASENFAKLLVKQGKYKKAIAVYQELILKNPEKKQYFASQIEALINKI